MRYDFYVLTTDGMKSTEVESDQDFECAPFGFVPYRVTSSCECAPAVIEDFWRCVDEVLAAHNITSDCYVRAVRAYKENRELCGEFEVDRI